MVKLTLALLLAFAGVAGAAPASSSVASDVTAPVVLASVSGSGGALGR